MTQRTLPILFAFAIFGSLASGCGSSSEYTDKCRSTCDASAVMQCAAMDSAACQSACEARLMGLTATCATCLTQSNAWQYGIDHRASGTGSSGGSCPGYAFPSITATSNGGCGNVCK